jgi:hypothetical protein
MTQLGSIDQWAADIGIQQRICNLRCELIAYDD